MAAALMRRELAKCGVADIRCESAGLAASPGAPASAGALVAMAEWGIDLSAHRARSATREDIARADGVYAMSASHAAALKTACPGAAGRIRVLGGGIPDPYGGDTAAYRRCRDAIAAAVEGEAARWV